MEPEQDKGPRDYPQFVSLVVCKGRLFSFRAFDLGEDLVRVLGPGGRAGMVVLVIDERADGGCEVGEEVKVLRRIA
jgi:hypothetical protein